MRIRLLGEFGECRVPWLRQMQPCTPALGVLLSRERHWPLPVKATALPFPPPGPVLSARYPARPFCPPGSLHLETPERHMELLLALRSSSFQLLCRHFGLGQEGAACWGQLAPGGKQGGSSLPCSLSLVRLSFPPAHREVALSWKALWL